MKMTKNGEEVHDMDADLYSLHKLLNLDDDFSRIEIHSELRKTDGTAVRVVLEVEP